MLFRLREDEEQMRKELADKEAAAAFAAAKKDRKRVSIFLIEESVHLGALFDGTEK